ncbi:uncharacterized protein LOC129589864 isoform X2 [Paramacrobiotus metropolitanus]|nr:uncharacterized protein LOC129589864 isoform X2 [Paramacrobiotus metropolitanus]
MDDGDDLYLEAFWISLSSADGECRTVTVSDLYFRLCMVIRSVTVLVRMAPVRRLLTREWTETKHLFHHVIFSNTKALDNLHSLPGVRKISAILTPLGELQFGCVSRSHELTENDPWSKLHTSSHGLTEGALIDQMGNFLDYITVENCRQFSDTHRTVHTVLPKDLRTHHSELCPQQSDEVMHRIACPFATTPNPPEMLKKDEFHSLMAAPRLQAAMHTLSPSKESDRQITKSALRALQEQTSCENLPSASGLLFSPQFDITGLTDIAKLQHPVFPKTTASKLLRTVQTSWRPIEEQFRENQQFYEQFCCEIKEQPDASTSS